MKTPNWTFLWCLHIIKLLSTENDETKTLILSWYMLRNNHEIFARFSSVIQGFKHIENSLENSFFNEFRHKRFPRKFPMWHNPTLPPPLLKMLNSIWSQPKSINREENVWNFFSFRFYRWWALVWNVHDRCQLDRTVLCFYLSLIDEFGIKVNEIFMTVAFISIRNDENKTPNILIHWH